MLLLRSTLILTLALALGACARAVDPEFLNVPRSLSTGGIDGPLTISSPGTTVNQYAILAADAAVAATSITVTNINDLTSATFGALAPGDLLLVHQAQGAALDATNTAAFGTVTALNSAGRYEFIGVASVSGNTINLVASGGGLRFAYIAAGHVQVVRVPQFTTLTIDVGASIVAPSWNGQKGGIVAIHAKDSVSLNGLIDVSSRGFRGGAIDNNSGSPSGDVTLYRSTASTDGGEQGESIAGYQADYTAFNGRFGRGAPANAGGGGNSYNGGGGGGANATAAGTWTGQGVMSGSILGNLAWLLDPGFLANGLSLTTSTGGGRGGYSQSTNLLDALVVAPGNLLWGGNRRRERGGLGGRPLTADPAGRLFFGGGGGAGDGDNNAAGAGGNGGGMALVITDTVTGAGQILANGANGGGTVAPHTDGAGGAGGGGTILVSASSLSGVTLSASGGAGGDQGAASGETEGPGGGGGGGYVVSSGGVVTINVGGALGGVTASAALSAFPSNGATAGNLGLSAALSVGLPFTVDTTPPDTTITGAPAAISNNPLAAFTFTATEPGIFQCRVDGGLWTVCTSPTVPLLAGDGSHTFAVRAIDSALNVDPTPATYVWTLDTGTPDTFIDSAPPPFASSTSATFDFSSDDGAATFECSLDLGAYAACTDPVTFNGLAQGAHTLSVRARDAAGNVDLLPALWAWTVDTSVPDTSILTGPPVNSPSATAIFTFSSNEVLAGFECNLDGGGFVACVTPKTYLLLADGAHSVQVRAKDAAGNTDATPAIWNWSVDTSSPDTFIVSGPPTNAASSTANFSFSSDEAGVTYECSLDAALFAACSASATFPGLADGSHVLRVRAKDAAGNSDLSPASQTWTIDTSAPDTTLLTTPPANAPSAMAIFTFASNEILATFECRLDGAAFGACLSPQTYLALSDGAHTFQVRARDASSNVDATPATFNWNVDTTIPDTTIVSGPASTSASASATFNFSSNETGVTYECSLDAAPFSTCANPSSFTSLADGAHILRVRAQDAAGNLDLVPATYLWTVDTTAPDTTLLTGPPAASASTTATFTFLSDDLLAVFDCSLDGAAFAACATPYTTPALPDGPHTLQIRARDLAGNVDPSPISRSWTIDTVDPNTSIVSGPPPASGFAYADFDFSSNEMPVTYECKLDLSPIFVPCANPSHFTPVVVGAHTLLVRARDSAGNVDSSPASFHWVVSLDIDGDGLPDVDEGLLGTDPMNPDTDGDGSLDGVEVLLLHTNPLDDDTDDDGILDGNEDANGNGIVDPSETNPLQADTDLDGLLDGTEISLTAPQGLDTNLSIFIADVNPLTQTDPLVADTDGGGVVDGSEDFNHDGNVDARESDPLNPSDDVDADGDGLSNVDEVLHGLNPHDADTDDDGLIDGLDGTADSDGDGLVNAADPDSDNDGLPDGLEAAITLATVHPDTDISAGYFVPDADPSTQTSPFLADSDHDRLGDGFEDTNRNGRVDAGETDPLQFDTDHDGLSDGIEARGANATNPLEADTDGDGLNDGVEDKNRNGAHDPHESDPNKADTDGGGRTDREELIQHTDPNDPKDDYIFAGSGCSLSPLSRHGPIAHDLGWAMALLLFLRRRRPRGPEFLALFLAVSFVSGKATADVSTAIDLQKFRVGPGVHDFLNLSSPLTAEPGEWRISILANYGHNPLSVLTPEQPPTHQPVLEAVTTGEVAFAMGVTRGVEIAVSLAATTQSPVIPPGLAAQFPDGIPTSGLNDLHLVPKFRFLHSAHWNFGAALGLTAPTGNSRAWMGNGTVTLQPKFLGELHWGRFRFVGNLGLDIRPESRISSTAVGNEVAYAIGTEVPLGPQSLGLTVLASLFGTLGLSKMSSTEAPLEVVAGASWRMSEALSLQMIYGMGLSRGYGTPDGRVVFGLTYLPTVERAAGQ